MEDTDARARSAIKQKKVPWGDELCHYAMDHAIDYGIAVIMKHMPFCIFGARVHFYGARSAEKTDFELGVLSSVVSSNLIFSP